MESRHLDQEAASSAAQSNFTLGEATHEVVSSVLGVLDDLVSLISIELLVESFHGVSQHVLVLEFDFGFWSVINRRQHLLTEGGWRILRLYGRDFGALGHSGLVVLVQSVCVLEKVEVTLKVFLLASQLSVLSGEST